MKRPQAELDSVNAGQMINPAPTAGTTDKGTANTPHDSSFRLNHPAKDFLGSTPTTARSHLRIPCLHLRKSSTWHGEKPGFKIPLPFSHLCNGDMVSLRKNACRLHLITIS